MSSTIDAIRKSISQKKAQTTNCDDLPDWRRQRIQELKIARIKPNTSHLSLFTLLKTPKDLFVKKAYAIILNRPCDPTGYDYYSALLKNAHFTPLEVLGTLRYSDEGRRIAIPIRGLWGLFIARKLRKKIPLIGYVVQLPFLFLGATSLLDWRTR